MPAERESLPDGVVAVALMVIFSSVLSRPLSDRWVAEVSHFSLTQRGATVLAAPASRPSPTGGLAAGLDPGAIVHMGTFNVVAISKRSLRQHPAVEQHDKDNYGTVYESTFPLLKFFLAGPHLTRPACLFPDAHHDGLQPTQLRVV